ncbi:hypothetical protein DCC39_17445 [Pueribacillus theae]|uniref:SCP2 domain-containing protein n=1 Tax=Pueribacillus theae TaxID=2171751 RepID=A0A2U1JN11_9BACI|nr:SCP2 sterol-binding domain-containing protein [Pueribacillus theae]PWA06395.1 hypothetical protein DCC39_17445 [Pueribacillus theae]
MNHELFSVEWVEQVEKEMKKGPSLERKNSVEPNYWNWIENCKKNLNIKLALVMKNDDGQNDRYAYFNIKEGEVVNGYIGTFEERGSADVVLSGTKADWIEVIEGPRNLTQNMMYRKIKLAQGNIHFFFRNIYYFVELLRCGLRVPIQEKLTSS